jgi:hypothetical protein
MENQEPIWKQAAFYIPRLIASFMSALSMDEKGLSLKKILSTYATWEAAQITNKEIAPNNVIILVLIWLVYAGILVGIYSITDISKALSSYRGKDEQKNEA